MVYSHVGQAFGTLFREKSHAVTIFRKRGGADSYFAVILPLQQADADLLSLAPALTLPAADGPEFAR